MFDTYSVPDTGVVDLPDLAGESTRDHAVSLVDGIGSFSERGYFEKFLTSPKLTLLQLADSQFRRQILVQFLILFHYLIYKTVLRSKK